MYGCSDCAKTIRSVNPACVCCAGSLPLIITVLPCCQCETVHRSATRARTQPRIPSTPSFMPEVLPYGFGAAMF